MPHIAPSYDMWQFGCLMAYTATMEKPFDSTIADAPKARSFNYGRDHWILGAMVERLGHMPRGVSVHKCFAERHMGHMGHMVLGVGHMPRGVSA
jgi:hypothetical protein